METGQLADGGTVSVARSRSNPLLACVRALGIVGWIAVCLTGCLVFSFLARSRKSAFAACARWTHYWFWGGARVMGLNVESRGVIPPPGSLIAPNHLGYVDVIAVGSLTPCLFVAKLDVESWPLVGFLFRASRHVGSPRGWARGVAAAASGVAERLREGSSVCVFLEGTSTGGDRVLPFHGPMMQPAIDTCAPVVPTSLTWRVARPGISVSEDVA